VRDIFFISDTHFDHANILKFEDNEGKKFRGDIFKDVSEMNEVMIDNWNEIVKPQDIIYHLGDVTFRVKDLGRIMSRLNGHKRLLVGNHDDPKNFELTRWFEKVGMWRLFKDEGFICTHVPIRADQFRYKVTHNVHGHIHQNTIDDEQYVNVCVEKTNYMPLSMDEVIQKCRRGA
jgi:calcineurin-like phosphoesterase family protein